MSRSPFPLQWPDGWKRCRSRFGSSFSKERGFNRTRDGALNELRLMGASHVVITSNLPTNSRGVPHSGSSGRIDDPGIAIWWVQSGRERVMACDRYPTCVENMHALELTIAALRGVDRWGATEMVERAFAGFAALPPGSSDSAAPPPKRTWAVVLGGPWPLELGRAGMLALAKQRHRALIAKHHPDRGGDHSVAAEINAALAEAEKELTS